MRTLIAKGSDARWRNYQLYDYGSSPWNPKTINGLLHDGTPYRYVCFYVGRTYTCSNNREDIIKQVKDATSGSCYYDMKGHFEMV